jgi:hypothetical protein
MFTSSRFLASIRFFQYLRFKVFSFLKRVIMTTTFRKSSLLVAAVVGSTLMTANVLAETTNCYYTDKFSEEAPSRADCNEKYAVRGLTCDGRYCDNKQLYCCADHLPTLDPDNNKDDSPWFSDPAGHADLTRVLTGLACQGRYCDDLQMRMFGFKNGTPIRNIQAIWVQGWFSEEQGGDKCKAYGYVVGMQCQGDYCDKLRLLCARYNVDEKVDKKKK